MTESVGKSYVVYDAVRYGKLGADHMRFSNDGRSTKKLGSTEAHSFTDEKIGTIVCTGTPYPKKGPVPPRAHPPTVPSNGASCRFGTVTWGASVSRRVIVAASDRRRTLPNIWVTLRLRDVVQLRSRFTTDHNYPRLAQDLVAAYSEKMSQDVGSVGSRYTNSNAEPAGRGVTCQLPSAAASTVTLLDVQMDRTPENGAGSVRRRIGDQPGSVEPAYQLGQRNLGFTPGQRATEAQVDAAAEPQVLVVTPIRVESVRIVEALRVAAA